MKNMLTITAILAVFVVGSGSESHGADQLQYLVPAVARVPGEAGSLWRSDLVLHNPGSVPATATLQYIERDQRREQFDSRSRIPCLVASPFQNRLAGFNIGDENTQRVVRHVSRVQCALNSERQLRFRCQNCARECDHRYRQ